ncbi:MAG TPA: HlyD family efflux transporter periplasmic adaptor subunit [Cellvibrio sp.]|nr:HlyD family efflux transporter periplasmic adaptor subunit [Cellvibrio sp.]
MKSVPSHFLRASLFMVAAQLIACSDNSTNLALGTLERDRVVLKATAAEIITQVPVVEGSDVKAGDLLLQLDDRRQKVVVAQAEASLASAQANLAKLKNGARTEDIAAARSQVVGAEAQLVEAQKMFKRAQVMVNKKLSSDAVLDSARATRDSAQAKLDTARENLLLLTNGSREEDLQQAEAQVALAQAALELQQYNLGELSIRATSNARLDHLPKHLGERTSVGEAVATLLDKNAPYARVYIPEPQRVNIRAGQELVVRVDGLAETQTGKLRWISQDPAFTPYFALNSTDRARLVYLAEVQLPASAANLPSGVPVQVELPHD